MIQSSEKAGSPGSQDVGLNQQTQERSVLSTKLREEEKDVPLPQEILITSNMDSIDAGRAPQNLQNTSVLRRNYLSSNQFTYEHMGTANFSPSERLVFAITDDDVATFKKL